MKSMNSTKPTRAIPFGLELTFIAKEGVSEYRAHNFELYQRIASKLNEREIRGFYCDTDPHVAELTTPVFKSVKEMVERIEPVLKVAEECNGLTEASWTTGGGCHVHVNKFKADRLNWLLLLDWAYRQTTAYAFNHPCATCGSTQKIKVGTNRDYFGYDEVKEPMPGRYIRRHWNSTSDKYRSLAIREKGMGTVEFRFFRMPNSIEQHKEHVEFVQAYMRKVKSLGIKGMVAHLKDRPLPADPQNVSLKEALAQFKETIEWVGLPWRTYRKYAENIRTRYAYHNHPEHGYAATERNFLN